MALNRALVGKSYPASEPYEVGREKVREFADAIGDANPAYRDRSAAEALGHSDVVAPPTFLTVLGYRTGAAVVGDPELGLDYSRVVHGEQRFVHHRPVRPGDVLVGVPTVTDIRAAGRNELLTITSEIGTTDGERVCTAVNTLVSRGTAPETGV